MFSKTIRIALLGTPADYRTSLLPLIIQGLGYRIQWVGPQRADLIIYGSFYNASAPRMRWLPRSWRGKAAALVDRAQETLFQRNFAPVTLFHTAENLRHDFIEADFAISHDLGVKSKRHYRLPYWMEMVDWSHEGLAGNVNPRYGQLLQIENLKKPLGRQFLERAHKAILISSHLREPRRNCLTTLQKIVPVDTMGSCFDPSIKNHHSSPFLKQAVLQNYAFNLCPENGLYPGYVTEKIPEAFASGCLPITYVDKAIDTDFNPNAMINLAPFLNGEAEGLVEIFQTRKLLEAYANESLVLQEPSIYPFREWVNVLIKSATQ